MPLYLGFRMPLYLGCPAWGVKGWIGGFLPAKTRQADLLAAYSRRLNTVEGNTTFYALPSPEQTERWRAATPQGFRFCLKFPQIISHRKRLADCEAETAMFVDRLRILGDRCGPAFLQLPPTFTRTHLPALRGYLDRLPSDLLFVVEPRHADFFDQAEGERALDDLLRQRGIARGVFDTTALFAIADGVTADVREAQQRKPRFASRATRTAGHAYALPAMPLYVSWVNPESPITCPGWKPGRNGSVHGWPPATTCTSSHTFRTTPTRPIWRACLARLVHARVSERFTLPSFGGVEPPPPTQPTLL